MFSFTPQNIQEQKALLLKASHSLMAIALFAALFLTTVDGIKLDFMLVALCFGISILSLFLHKTSFEKVSPHFLLNLLLLLGFVIGIEGFGLRSSSSYGLFGVVILAALLLGRNWLVFYGFLAYLMVVALYSYEAFGYLNSPFKDSNNLNTLASIAIYYLIMTAMLWLLVYHWESLFVAASLQEYELKQQNDLLAATQEHLIELNYQLEQRVFERTQALETAQITTEVALKKALESDQVKSQFLAAMSHEIRTPLNAILVFTELMQQSVFGQINAEQGDYLNKILYSGRHLLSLINDVLDVAAIQAGSLKWHWQKQFDLAHEIRETVTSLAPNLQTKAVSIKLNLPGSLQFIECDQRRIRQVLFNLINNAIKFTHEGTITISVYENNQRLLCSIHDTGTGISSHEQGLIFEPFFQTESGMKHTAGTGLGLPISKQIIEAHGGNLWLESIEGFGSTFYFALPYQARQVKKRLGA